MPTFLTTPRMSPELAARVNASVGGRTARRPTRWLRMLLLLGIAATIVGSIASLFVARSRRSDALESRRARLLERVEARGAQVDEAGRLMLQRSERLLLGLGAPYEGDFIADSMRDSAAVSAALARPTTYMRGSIEAFDSAQSLAFAAETSFRDAFVLCLNDPPAKRSEKALLQRARAAFAGGEQTLPVAHVERLNDALVGLPLLAPDWQARVRAAETEPEVARLQSEFERAPIDGAVRAAKTEQLLVAVDEPKLGTGPTELDGACPHFVRVYLFELATERLLLRVRKHVDPTALSDDAKVSHANGINSCELGIAVRAELKSLPAAAHSAR